MKETVETIKKEKIVAIVRGVALPDQKKLAKALYEGGIRVMEITFDQKDPSLWKETAEAISAIRAEWEGKMTVGAGTVVLPEQLDLAYRAGAQLIISPDANEAIIRRTAELGLASLPGAMTPTEILAAYRWGADFVKVFPAGALGLAYFKAIRAPISQVPLLAVGGVDENNLADFLAAGAAGAGIGGNLVKKDWIRAGDFGRITAAARQIVAAAQNK